MWRVSSYRVGILHAAITDVYKGGRYTCAIAKLVQSQPRWERRENQDGGWDPNSEGVDEADNGYQKGV